MEMSFEACRGEQDPVLMKQAQWKMPPKPSRPQE